MIDVDELGKHAENLISALQNIIRSLNDALADQKRAVSFEQVKEIENTISRLSRQGLPIPMELKDLKLKLLSDHEQHEKRLALYQRLQAGLANLQENANYHIPKGTIVDHPKPSPYPARKPSNIERPLGSKGNSNLDDYLIPVIKLMWKGVDHAEAFRKVARHLDVRYNTVSSQCTRALDLTTDEFVRQVSSKEIVSLLKRKYPDQYQKINLELNM